MASHGRDLQLESLLEQIRVLASQPPELPFLGGGAKEAGALDRDRETGLDDRGDALLSGHAKLLQRIDELEAVIPLLALADRLGPVLVDVLDSVQVSGSRIVSYEFHRFDPAPLTVEPDRMRVPLVGS